MCETTDHRVSIRTSICDGRGALKRDAGTSSPTSTAPPAPSDVASAVCARFAEGDWRALDDAAYAGRVSLRDAIDAQTRMLRASRGRDAGLRPRALHRRPHVPGARAPGARRGGRRSRSSATASASTCAPCSTRPGSATCPCWRTRSRRPPDGLRLAHPHAHPRCAGCGTCKAQAVLSARADRRVGRVRRRRHDGPLRRPVRGRGLREGPARGAVLPRPASATVPWTDFDDVAGVLAEGAGTAHGRPRRAPDVTALPRLEPARVARRGRHEVNEVLERIAEGVRDGDRSRGREAGRRGARGRASRRATVLTEGLIPGLQQLGQLFKDGQAYLPEILISVRAMTARPRAAAAAPRRRRRARAGASSSSARWRATCTTSASGSWACCSAATASTVVDLGVDVSAARFAAAARGAPAPTSWRSRRCSRRPRRSSAASSTRSRSAACAAASP